MYVCIKECVQSEFKPIINEVDFEAVFLFYLISSLLQREVLSFNNIDLDSLRISWELKNERKTTRKPLEILISKGV